MEFEVDDGVKALITSKTFWGAIVSLLAGLAAVFHYSVSAADQAQIVDLAVGLVGVAGSVGAIYGRIVATKQIGSIK